MAYEIMFKGSRVQGFKGSKVQRFNVQGFSVQSFKVQMFKRIRHLSLGIFGATWNFFPHASENKTRANKVLAGFTRNELRSSVSLSPLSLSPLIKLRFGI